LVCDPEIRPDTAGIPEQGAEVNIWTQGASDNRRHEEEFQNFCAP
jgi:hypothetical protein